MARITVEDCVAKIPNKFQLVLVAAKRELIENRLSLLTDAGLTPATIDVDAFALHNAFERSYPELLGGMVALVNVGHETTNVNLLDNAVPILVRDIPFGSRRLRESLQRERGLPADQADLLDTQVRSAQVSADLHMVALELRSELQRLRSELPQQAAGAEALASRLVDLTSD